MKLIIPKEIEAKIHAYVMSVPSEIAGMGKIAVSPDGSTTTVEEVMIYEQEVTGATADLSPQAIAKWQSELVKSGGSPKHWKLWWHSHANMQAFFSGTDTDTMDRQTEGDWMISLVVNKRREREARLDLYRPFRMYMEKIHVQIGTEAETAYQVPADIAEEVARKVKQAVPTYQTMGYGTHQTTGVDLHRYCPMFTTGARQCYHPNGKNEDCTSKVFKQKYGANPFMTESDYTRDQLVSITKTLEAQLEEYETRGLAETSDCQEIAAELVEMYYQLADTEASGIIAETVRTKARKLENDLYQMDPELTLPL